MFSLEEEKEEEEEATIKYSCWRSLLRFLD